MEAGVDSGAPREPSHHDRRLAAGLAVAGFGTRVVAVPELAVGVEPPALDAAVRAQREGVAVTCGERRNAREARHGCRLVMVGGRAIAELSGGVAAPRHGGPVRAAGE